MRVSSEVNKLSLNQTGNYPHEGCSSGSAKPLRVTRKANGYVWYCYRCTLGGFARSANANFKLEGCYKSGSGPVSKDIRYDEGYDKRDYALNGGSDFTLPSGVTPVRYSPKGTAREWAERYCSLDELDRHKVRILGNTLYVPLSQGYTYRVFDPSWKGPKWVHKVDSGSLDRFLYIPHPVSDCLCIVEDCFSGFCVSRHTSALCLLGTHASEYMLAWIQRRSYPRIRVFLDDDNLYVKRSQSNLQRRLSLFCDDVNVIHSGGRDPKEHSDEELKELLNEGM